MRLGIDITSILYQRGVSRYTNNLVRALAQEKNLELNLFGSSLRQYSQLNNIADDILDLTENGKKRIFRLPPTALAKLWRFGQKKIHPEMPGIEVFHSWDWLQPPDQTFPLVSTVHDLALLKFPETAHSKIKKMHQRSWEVLKKRQSHLIAVSRSTKKDLVELLGYPPYLVHVIYEALPREYRQVSDSLDEEKYEVIKSRLELNKPYVFFVGTREPRKNLVRLIQAWEPLHQDVALVIAGESGWDETEEFNSEKMRQKGLRFLDKVSDEELAVLYAEAQVFAYPSLYEGFGLPILEAFHEGTPVITSNNSGMLEVAGNAAELIDPYEVASIRQGLEKILSESTAEQQKRLQRMIIRLQMFGWDRVAKETLEVYKQAITDFNE